ncbi:MAG: barstar family protein [Dehalobacterium sp.]|jgi:ribonuclease inhibitor
MRDVILDGAEMISIDAAHGYIAAMLNFPDYYGRNLDALWDLLSTISEPTQIKLINEEKIIDYLGDYGRSFLGVIYDAVQVNEKITFCDS